MLHRILKVFAILLAAILVAGCASSPTPAPTQQPPTAAPRATTPSPTQVPATPKAKLLAYNYTLKDAGDGWNNGTLQLAFGNVSKELVGGEKIVLTGGNVETQEGKTYPVKLYYYDPGGLGANIETQNIDFSELPKVVPPNFRWTKSFQGHPVTYSIQFRAAVAAHPLRIVFSSRPDLGIDLNSVPQSLRFPADGTVLSATKPLSALAGKVLADDPRGLLVTLDGTGFQEGQRLQLRYTAVNRDKLDSHKANIDKSFLSYFYWDGAVSPEIPQTSTELVEVGPGQTKHDSFFIGYVFMNSECNPEFYAVAQEGTQYSVYKLNVCK